MYIEKETSTREDKNQDIINAEKQIPKATINIEQNKKLCTRAKDNLSKKKKMGISSRRKEIVSRVLIKMHPLCRQRCCFPLLLLKCQKRSVLFFSSMCSQEADCSSRSLSLLCLFLSSTISPALTLAAIIIIIIATTSVLL